MLDASTHRHGGWYRAWGKRAFDVLASTTLLGVLAPLLAGAALGVASPSRGPVLLRQNRIGRGERQFWLLKFRSMIDEPRSLGSEIVGREPFVTPIGRFLRRFKIDELPQLVNVLRGEMSIVGPRPMMAEQLRNLPDWARARHAVAPGLTGLAQIRGNILMSWSDRWKHDLRYVDDLSFWLDLKVVRATVGVILRGDESGLGTH